MSGYYTAVRDRYMQLYNENADNVWGLPKEIESNGEHIYIWDNQHITVREENDGNSNRYIETEAVEGSDEEEEAKFEISDNSSRFSRSSTRINQIMEPKSSHKVYKDWVNAFSSLGSQGYKLPHYHFLWKVDSVDDKTVLYILNFFEIGFPIDKAIKTNRVYPLSIQDANEITKHPEKLSFLLRQRFRQNEAAFPVLYF